MEVTGCPSLPPVDIEDAAIVGGEEQRRPLNGPVRRQGEHAPETARANRRGLVRLALREPDPLRIAEEVLRGPAAFGLVQPDPGSVPIRRVEQRSEEQPSELQSRQY